MSFLNFLNRNKLDIRLIFGVHVGLMVTNIDSKNQLSWTPVFVTIFKITLI
jgi:hypothetical protein